MPPVNSKVFYFPQGHAEHAQAHVDFSSASLRIPSLILCRVASIKFMADPETDEVFAKIKLNPIENNEPYASDEGSMEADGSENQEKPASFAKTLTQSDANNGGGFSVPRYCAETIFPRLDYSADPPVQTVIAKDVHGEIWKFRHIYRGTPRRHLLTTGWSTFVNQKKLVAGDSIVFLRAENGDLCVGIRRAKRGLDGAGGPELASGWNNSHGGGSGACVLPYGGFSVFLREEENKMVRNGGGNLSPNGNLRGKGRVRPESVVEAATLAANGQAFEVVYYPRASTPEFCVKASAVRAAMRVQWCSGMRFKMAFETEDSSRISWFMGTIASVQVSDPIRWPNSPWRLLQVLYCSVIWCSNCTSFLEFCCLFFYFFLFSEVVFLGLFLHVVLFGLLVGTRERTIRFLFPRIMSCLASFALYQFVKILESEVSRFGSSHLVRCAEMFLSESECF